MTKAKKFEKPEDLSALTDDELASASDAALDEFTELAGIADDEITDEQIDRLEELKGALTEISTEQGGRAEAVEARAARIAAAKAGVEAPADEEPEEGGDEEPEEGADEEAEEEAEVEEKVPALVAAGRRRNVTRTVARRSSKPAAEPETPAERKATITAQAEVRGFAAGQDLTMDQATEAFMSRIASLPGGGSRRVGKMVQKHGVAAIQKPEEERYTAFAIDDRMSSEVAWSNIMQASREQNLGQSLVAAGGWCAPSENFYDLCQWETTSGGLDLPTITVTRGGINFTKGPDFSSIYTNTGFLQTEADAIAGEVKTFLEVECPDWEDIRLDAIGYGVKAPILTASAAGFPELVRRYLEGALVAHWHKVNAYVINRVTTELGTAQNFAELGSGAADLLEAIEVAAQSLRYKFRLGETATLEAMFPMWAMSALRADLSRRTGVDMLAVTDAQIRSWFTLRGIRPQFVYDWASQELSSTALKFPGSIQFGIWPAGTFVKGENSIISLDAIYDSTEIETNTYTAAFFEEAILVANTCGDGRLFEVGLNYNGRTGAADITGDPVS